MIREGLGGSKLGSAERERCECVLASEFDLAGLDSIRIGEKGALPPLDWERGCLVVLG